MELLIGALQEALVTGAVEEVDLLTAADSPALVLRSPSGKERHLPSGTEKISIGPLDEVGLWTIAGPQSAGENASPPIRQFACNLGSRRESDLRLPELLRERPTPVLAGAFGFVRPLWFYLIGLAWLLAAVEWFLYQRRWIS